MHKSISRGVGILAVRRVLIHAFLILLCAVTILPLWMILVNATSSNNEINLGISLIPKDNLLQNWQDFIGFGVNPFQCLFNSLVISLGTAFVSLYASAMMAYSLVVYEYRFRKFLAGLVICLLMVPGQIVAIGYYKLAYSVGLTNNFLALILPSIAAPAAVYFIRQYLRDAISLEFVQAGRIDGASEFGIFNRIMMPIMMPAIYTQAIFTFVGSWNTLFMPTLLLSNPKMSTLPMMVAMLKADTYREQLGAQYLGIAFAVLPITLIYFMISRQIIGGIALGGIKE